MKEVKFYCDFCGNEITEAVSKGNFDKPKCVNIRVDIEITRYNEHSGKDACVECLVKLLTGKESTTMMNKAMGKNPLPMKRKSAVDNGEDDF